MKNKSNIIVMFLNIITILVCLNYEIYNVFVNFLVVLDTCCMLILLGTRIKRKFFIYFLILLGITVSVCLINGGGIGSILVLVNFVLMIYISTYVTIDLKYIKILAICYMALLLYWNFFGKLSLYNTNTIGIIALLGVCFGIIYSTTLKSKTMALILIVAILGVSYFVEKNLSQSRTCFICGVLLTILVYFIPPKLFSNKTVYWIMCSALTFGSLLWTQVYLYLYQNSIELTLSFSDKRFFSGREAIWMEMWDQLKSKWLTGVGTGYSMNSLASGGFNVHNSIFNFLAVYGVLAFMLLMVLIFFKFKDQYDKVRFKRRELSYIGLCCVIIIFVHAFTETTLISSVFYGPLFTLLCLVNPTKTTQTSQCESLDEDRQEIAGRGISPVPRGRRGAYADQTPPANRP